MMRGLIESIRGTADELAHRNEPAGMVDLEGRVVAWNAALERLSGVSRADALTRPLSELLASLEPVGKFPGAGDLGAGIGDWSGLGVFQPSRDKRGRVSVSWHLCAVPSDDRYVFAASRVPVPGAKPAAGMTPVDREVSVVDAESERLPTVVRVDRDLASVVLSLSEDDDTGRCLDDAIRNLHAGLTSRSGPEDWVAHYRAVLETGRPKAFRADFDWNGDRRYVQCHLLPERDSSGKVVSALGVFADVTHRAEARAAATESTQKLALLLAQIPGFCYIVDKDLVFTSSVGAGLEALSLEQNQVVGMDLYELHRTDSPAHLPIACHYRALAGQPQRYSDMCMGRSLDFYIRPLRDGEGEIIGVVGIGLDVTEREQAKEHEAALAAQLRQAQKMESIGRLAGGVAHDFNNLLTCIIGNIALATRQLGPDSSARHHLNEANAAAESAAALTRQLLAFGRKQMIQPRAFDLNALIERVDGMLRRLIGEEITLKTATAEGLWSIRADPGQLEQVLVNLLVNARDAISGRGEITVETVNREIGGTEGRGPGTLAPGQYVELIVADTGRGMSDAVQAKLFEPFFTTKGVGEGTGLGLATVYGAVQQNGGTVEVESTLGEGTTFRIYLPRTEGAEDRVSGFGDEVDGGPLGDGLEAPGGSETILLVEDEPLALELAQCTLQQLGYDVIACTCADDALAKVAEKESRIDLLLTDVVMPRINGRELAERLSPLQPGMKVLYTSGYGESIIANHGILDAEVHFIGKPYTPTSLGRKVREVLESVGARPADGHRDGVGVDAVG